MFRAVGVSGDGEIGVRGAMAMGDLRLSDGRPVGAACVEILRESFGFKALDGASILTTFFGYSFDLY